MIKHAVMKQVKKGFIATEKEPIEDDYVIAGTNSIKQEPNEDDGKCIIIITY